MTVLRNIELHLVESPFTMSHGGDFGGAVRVGAELRAARERLGWTLPSVAGYLRIRAAYLLALEEGSVAQLPGQAVAAGFVRSYAQALGLDAAAVSRRFRAELGDNAFRPRLDFPVPAPERGVPALAVVALGTLLAVVAYAGWYRMSGETGPGDVVQQVPERLAPLIDTPAPKPVVAAPPPVASPIAPPIAAPPAPVRLAAQPPPPRDGPRLVLRAKAAAWLHVRDKRTGQVLLNRTLRPGETWPVPPHPAPLLLTDGNVSGTEVLVDGVPAPPFGVEGRVLRDLPLDPDALKAGRVAAAKPVTPGALP